MAPQNETILVAAVAAFLPSLGALCLAIAGYIKGTGAAKESGKNTRRLDRLENGGGDAKIDARLARHGLIDRRDAPDGPHVGPAIVEAVTAVSEAKAGIMGASAAPAAPTVSAGAGIGPGPLGGTPE